jgi:hypothetical protein
MEFEHTRRRPLIGLKKPPPPPPIPACQPQCHMPADRVGETRHTPHASRDWMGRLVGVSWSTPSRPTFPYRNPGCIHSISTHVGSSRNTHACSSSKRVSRTTHTHTHTHMQTIEHHHKREYEGCGMSESPLDELAFHASRWEVVHAVVIVVDLTSLEQEQREPRSHSGNQDSAGSQEVHVVSETTTRRVSEWLSVLRADSFSTKAQPNRVVSSWVVG